MNCFLDTSSLIKLYHFENESGEIIGYIKRNKINKIFLSVLAQVEFSSAFWKKVRMGEIEKNRCIEVIDCFESDFKKFNWIEIDDEIIFNSKNLINTYGNDGLRTLDSIQLSTAIILRTNNCVNIVSDKLLKKIFQIEKLNLL